MSLRWSEMNADQRADDIRGLRARHESVSAMARRVGCTNRSIVDWATRRGIPLPPPPNSMGITRYAAPRTGAQPGADPRYATPQPGQPVPPAPGEQRLLLTDLRLNTCRRPLWSDLGPVPPYSTAFYCGAPCPEDAAWCGHCASYMTRKPYLWERDVARSVRRAVGYEQRVATVAPSGD